MGPKEMGVMINYIVSEESGVQLVLHLYAYTLTTLVDESVFLGKEESVGVMDVVSGGSCYR